MAITPFYSLKYLEFFGGIVDSDFSVSGSDCAHQVVRTKFNASYILPVSVDSLHHGFHILVQDDY